VQSPTLVGELGMVMPGGKFAFEWNGHFGFRYIDEGVGRTDKPFSTINFDKQ
jgi:hypothetical protein